MQVQHCCWKGSKNTFSSAHTVSLAGRQNTAPFVLLLLFSTQLMSQCDLERNITLEKSCVFRTGTKPQTTTAATEKMNFLVNFHTAAEKRRSDLLLIRAIWERPVFIGLLMNRQWAWTNEEWRITKKTKKTNANTNICWHFPLNGAQNRAQTLLKNRVWLMWTKV